MASRWLFVRIRAAERALQDGRIDEALAAATQPDVRDHRRGRRLLDELARPLVARARLHLQAGRYQPALEDLDRLSAIGHAGPDVEELRQRISEQMREHRQRDTEAEAACRRAAADLNAGHLESGRLAIERVDDSQRREDLREQLDIRLQRSTQLLAQANEALGRGDVLAGLRLWQEACERHGRTSASDELAGRLGSAYRHELDTCFSQGRLEPLLASRPGIAALRSFSPALDELDQVGALCTRAASQLANRDYAALKETALRLRAARANVGWIDAVLAALAKVGEGQDALLASPLGLFASLAGRAAAELPANADGRVMRGPGSPHANLDETRAAGLPVDPAAASLRARPLLLLMDGAGSSLLVPQDCVRIGRAGGSRPIDIPIPADIQSHHADIVRDGEDYFLTALGPLLVNQREAKRTLLRDGDRVALADAAKFVFRKPSVRSASAVLQFSHRCRLPQDVSSIVLFRETCLLGTQTSCHIRTPEGQAQVVLFDRAGRLYGRQTTAGGGKLGDAKPLRLGETIDFGDVRVTVKDYDPTDSGGRA